MFISVLRDADYCYFETKLNWSTSNLQLRAYSVNLSKIRIILQAVMQPEDEIVLSINLESKRVCLRNNQFRLIKEVRNFFFKIIRK